MRACGFLLSFKQSPQARRKIMFINYDYNDHMAPPAPTLFQLLSLKPLWGLSPTPDSRPNPVCGLGAFQEPQAKFSDFTSQLGTWVHASPLLCIQDPCLDSYPSMYLCTTTCLDNLTRVQCLRKWHEVPCIWDPGSSSILDVLTICLGPLFNSILLGSVFH